MPIQTALDLLKKDCPSSEIKELVREVFLKNLEFTNELKELKDQQFKRATMQDLPLFSVTQEMAGNQLTSSF